MSTAVRYLINLKREKYAQPNQSGDGLLRRIQMGPLDN